MTGPPATERDGPPKTRVEIVDDHLLFAQALGDMVRSLAEYDVVGIAQSGAEAVAIARDTQPDLILLDFHLPGVDALELIPDIRSLSPRSRIVVLTSDTSEATRTAAITAGVDGFLTKDQALDDISDALASALPKGPVRPPVAPLPRPIAPVAPTIAPPAPAPVAPVAPPIALPAPAPVASVAAPPPPSVAPVAAPPSSVAPVAAPPRPQPAPVVPVAAPPPPSVAPVAAQPPPQPAPVAPVAPPVAPPPVAHVAAPPPAAIAPRPEPVSPPISVPPEPVAAPPAAVRVGQVVAVYSPKGGVGTTTVAINLAVALAALPDTRVGMLDLDLLSGDVAVMMDIRPARTVADLAWDRRLDESAIEEMFAVHRSGVRVLAAPSGFSAVDVIDPDRVIAAIDELRAEFTHVVIDLSTALGRLNVDVLRFADRVVLVTTPELAALRQLARVLGRRPSLDLGARSLIVVNRSPGAASIPIPDVERALGRSVAVTIRSDGVAATEAANAGAPVSGRSTRIAGSYKTLAGMVLSGSRVSRG